MAPSVKCLLSFTLGLAAASSICNETDGALSESCLDEAASFLQVSKHATTSGSRMGSSIQADTVRKTNKVTEITPVSCDVLNKPIQILKTDTGYMAKRLNVSTGVYLEFFQVPFDKVPGNYENIGGCGINPLDSIIYCSMFAGGSYVVRLDRMSGDVEFVARLPWFKPYNSGDFAPNGIFFVGTWYGEFLAVKDLNLAKGCPASNKNCEDIIDLQQRQRQKPEKFGHAADCIAVTANLEGNGWETYLFVMYTKYLYIAKYDNVTDTFPRSWKMKVNPGRGDFIFGAGWNFQNQLFYSVNSGAGVFQIPLENWTTTTLTQSEDPTFELNLTLIGESEAQGSNDGLACMSDPNPWVTNMQTFDCKANSGALQATVHGTGYDITSVDLDTGVPEVIYTIPNSHTDPPFRTMNGFTINPMDSVVYACLVMDGWDEDMYPTPPPFYVVRVDDLKIEFIAKVQAPKGSPVSGAMDVYGNFYIISNPSVIKIPFAHRLKGYTSQNDTELPMYDEEDTDIFLIEEMPRTSQIADIVVVPGDFDGKGEGQWIVGVNVYSQLLAIKVSEPTPEHYVIPCSEPISALVDTPNHRQNFGAAWHVNGEVLVGSNDGVGVFKVPLDKIQVPDGPEVVLEKVGESPASYDNDGLNCIESNTVFWGRGVKFDN